MEEREQAVSEKERKDGKMREGRDVHHREYRLGGKGKRRPKNSVNS